MERIDKIISSQGNYSRSDVKKNKKPKTKLQKEFF